MNNENLTIHFKSITQQHELMRIAKPKHPLFSIIRFEDIPEIENNQRIRLISDFYHITLKKECPCKIQYGQSMFDFDEGIISCFAPKQVSIIDQDFAFAKSGWQLSIHPDFLRTYPLSQKIKNYGFFDYTVNEALILSAEEQSAMESVFEHIHREYQLPIDNFSQDVIINNIEVLLSYCNRYYNRQFITRKVYHSELLSKVESVFNVYFSTNNHAGLLTPGQLANELNISPKYLSDSLKSITGLTTQQLIHEKLIEQAKDFLASTALSVAEIAYKLGFEYPQSFNKLFKNKTSQTPIEYRQLFN